MPALSPFEYATIRVVPRVERGEFVNVGVVLYCRPRRFLDARIDLGEPQVAALAALAPDLDLDAVRRRLDTLRRVCAGDATGGPIALLPQFERFGWLVAPLSTVVQPSPVHAGLCADPAATLDRLARTMVDGRGSPSSEAGSTGSTWTRPRESAQERHTAGRRVDS